MRWIHKGREPDSWAEYRISTPGASYEAAPKQELRRALLAEQGYLCCYCMRRIDSETTRIEHRIPRHGPHGDPSQELSYRNLLAACQGGEGRDRSLLHCDVRKHDDKISIDPADPSRDIELLIRYSSSGAIDSDDSIHHDLNVTLNLNLERSPERTAIGLTRVTRRLEPPYRGAVMAAAAGEEAGERAGENGKAIGAQGGRPKEAAKARTGGLRRAVKSDERPGVRRRARL